MRTVFASLALLVLASGAVALPDSLPADCRRQIFDAAHLEPVPVKPAQESLAKAKAAVEQAVDDQRHFQSRVQNRYDECRREDKEDLDALAKELVREYKTATDLEHEYKSLESVQDEDAFAVRAIFEKHAIAEIDAHKRLLAAEARVDACYEAHRTGAAPAIRKAGVRAAAARTAVGEAEEALRIAGAGTACENKLQGVLSSVQVEATNVNGAFVSVLRQVCPHALRDFAFEGDALSATDISNFCAPAVASFKLTLTGGRKDARNRAVGQFCHSAVHPKTFTKRLTRPVDSLQADFCDAPQAPATTGATGPAAPAATGVYLPPVEVAESGEGTVQSDDVPATAPAATASAATGTAEEAAPESNDKPHLMHALDDGSYRQGPTVTFKGPEFSSTQRGHALRPLPSCISECRAHGRTGPDCYRACMSPRARAGEPAAPLPKKPAAPVESADDLTSDLTKCWQHCHTSGDDKPSCYHGCIHKHAN